LFFAKKVNVNKTHQLIPGIVTVIWGVMEPHCFVCEPIHCEPMLTDREVSSSGLFTFGQMAPPVLLSCLPPPGIVIFATLPAP
jgi:hypothetical protein